MWFIIQGRLVFIDALSAYAFYLNISPHQNMTQSLKNQIFLLLSFFLFDNINYLNFMSRTGF